MFITISTLNGKKYVVECDENEAVSDLKNHIYEKCNIIPERQTLIFCGKRLIDDVKISAYSMENKTTIHLVIIDEYEYWERKINNKKVKLLDERCSAIKQDLSNISETHISEKKHLMELIMSCQKKQKKVIADLSAKIEQLIDDKVELLSKVDKYSKKYRRVIDEKNKILKKYAKLSKSKVSRTITDPSREFKKMHLDLLSDTSLYQMYENNFIPHH